MFIRRNKGSNEPQIQGFSRVLVGVDFSEASRCAMQLACTLVGANAMIYAIHVAPDLAGTAKRYVKDPEAKELQRKIAEEAMSKLTAWANKNMSVNCKLECVISAGDPASEIIKAAESKGAQLILLGVHGEHRSDLGKLGSNLEKVARASECPVLCVPTERV